MKSLGGLAAPIAAMAFGALSLSALSLGACNNDDEVLADNSYSVPSERDGPNESLSGYSTPRPSTPAPGTLGNPDTSSDTTPPPILPPNPDDPVQRPPGSPPTPLP